MPNKSQITYGRKRKSQRLIIAFWSIKHQIYIIRKILQWTLQVLAEIGWKLLTSEAASRHFNPQGSLREQIRFPGRSTRQCVQWTELGGKLYSEQKAHTQSIPAHEIRDEFTSKISIIINLSRSFKSIQSARRFSMLMPRCSSPRRLSYWD